MPKQRQLPLLGPRRRCDRLRHVFLPSSCHFPAFQAFAALARAFARVSTIVLRLVLKGSLRSAIFAEDNHKAIISP